jgi:hypothetical protein
MSIFTHMLPAAIHNYINELSRVMKPGAKAFITTFLLNEESELAIKSGRSAIPFPHSSWRLLGDGQVLPGSGNYHTGKSGQELVFGCRVSDDWSRIWRSWAGRSDSENLHDDLIVQKL